MSAIAKEHWGYVKAFPVFFLGLVLGLVKAVLTEIEVFLVALFGILLALQAGPLLGATVALGIYVVFRILGRYTILVASKMELLAQVIYRKGTGPVGVGTITGEQPKQ